MRHECNTPPISPTSKNHQNPSKVHDGSNDGVNKYRETLRVIRRNTFQSTLKNGSKRTREREREEKKTRTTAAIVRDVGLNTKWQSKSRRCRWLSKIIDPRRWHFYEFWARYFLRRHACVIASIQRINASLLPEMLILFSSIAPKTITMISARRVTRSPADVTVDNNAENHEGSRMHGSHSVSVRLKKSYEIGSFPRDTRDEITRLADARADSLRRANGTRAHALVWVSMIMRVRVHVCTCVCALT